VVERAPDPSVVVPFTERWTVAQVMAHLVTVAVRYSPAGADTRTWAPEAKDVAALNDAQIAGLDTHDLRRVISALRAALVALPSGPEVDTAPALPYTGGVQVRPADLLGLMLGEFVVHGHDLAGVLGQPWPIDQESAVEVIESMNAILPAWVDTDRARGVDAVIEVRLRGAGQHVWQFTAGALTVDPPSPRPADVVMSVEPVAFLLLSYRRVPLWRVVLSGKSRAWGRRPMVAFKLGGWLRSP
jgi:hypothetical protein